MSYSGSDSDYNSDSDSLSLSSLSDIAPRRNQTRGYKSGNKDIEPLHFRDEAPPKRWVGQLENIDIEEASFELRRQVADQSMAGSTVRYDPLEIVQDTDQIFAVLHAQNLKDQERKISRNIKKYSPGAEMDITSLFFDPTTFLSRAHKNSSHERLEVGILKLATTAATRSNNIKKLVSLHFGQFVHCKDTIDLIQQLLKSELPPDSVRLDLLASRLQNLPWLVNTFTPIQQEQLCAILVAKEQQKVIQQQQLLLQKQESIKDSQRIFQYRTAPAGGTPQQTTQAKPVATGSAGAISMDMASPFAFAYSMNNMQTVSDKSRVGRLQLVLSTVAEKTDAIYSPLLARRSETDQIRSALHTFRKYKILLELPKRMRAHITNGRIDRLVHDNNRLKMIRIGPTPNNYFLKKALLECHDIRRHYANILLNRLSDPRHNLYSQQRTMSYLFQLEDKVDPTWFFLERQALHISSLLDRAYYDSSLTFVKSTFVSISDKKRSFFDRISNFDPNSSTNGLYNFQDGDLEDDDLDDNYNMFHDGPTAPPAGPNGSAFAQTVKQINSVAPPTSFNEYSPRSRNRRPRPFSQLPLEEQQQLLSYPQPHETFLQGEYSSSQSSALPLFLRRPQNLSLAQAELIATNLIHIFTAHIQPLLKLAYNVGSGSLFEAIKSSFANNNGLGALNFNTAAFSKQSISFKSLSRLKILITNISSKLVLYLTSLCIPELDLNQLCGFSTKVLNPENEFSRQNLPGSPHSPKMSALDLAYAESHPDNPVNRLQRRTISSKRTSADDSSIGVPFDGKNSISDNPIQLLPHSLDFSNPNEPGNNSNFNRAQIKNEFLQFSNNLKQKKALATNTSYVSSVTQDTVYTQRSYLHTVPIDKIKTVLPRNPADPVQPIPVASFSHVVLHGLSKLLLILVNNKIVIFDPTLIDLILSFYALLYQSTQNYLLISASVQITTLREHWTLASSSVFYHNQTTILPAQFQTILETYLQSMKVLPTKQLLVRGLLYLNAPPQLTLISSYSELVLAFADRLHSIAIPQNPTRLLDPTLNSGLETTSISIEEVNARKSQEAVLTTRTEEITTTKIMVKKTIIGKDGKEEVIMSEEVLEDEATPTVDVKTETIKDSSDYDGYFLRKDESADETDNTQSREKNMTLSRFSHELLSLAEQLNYNQHSQEPYAVGDVVMSNARFVYNLDERNGLGHDHLANLGLDTHQIQRITSAQAAGLKVNTMIQMGSKNNNPNGGSNSSSSSNSSTNVVTNYLSGNNQNVLAKTTQNNPQQPNQNQNQNPNQNQNQNQNNILPSEDRILLASLSNCIHTSQTIIPRAWRNLAVFFQQTWPVKELLEMSYHLNNSITQYNEALSDPNTRSKYNNAIRSDLDVLKSKYNPTGKSTGTVYKMDNKNNFAKQNAAKSKQKGSNKRVKFSTGLTDSDDTETDGDDDDDDDDDDDYVDLGTDSTDDSSYSDMSSDLEELNIKPTAEVNSLGLSPELWESLSVKQQHYLNTSVVGGIGVAMSLALDNSYRRVQGVFILLQSTLAQKYIQNKSNVINALIYDALFRGGINWRKAPIPTHVREFIYTFLQCLVEAKSELILFQNIDVSSIMTTIIENVIVTWCSLVRRIRILSYNGAMQLGLETNFIAFSLNRYTNPYCISLIQDLLSLIHSYVEETILTENVNTSFNPSGANGLYTDPNGDGFDSQLFDAVSRLGMFTTHHKQRLDENTGYEMSTSISPLQSIILQKRNSGTMSNQRRSSQQYNSRNTQNEVSILQSALRGDEKRSRKVVSRVATTIDDDSDSSDFGQDYDDDGHEDDVFYDENEEDDEAALISGVISMRDLKLYNTHQVNKDLMVQFKLHTSHIDIDNILQQSLWTTRLSYATLRQDSEDPLRLLILDDSNARISKFKREQMDTDSGFQRTYRTPEEVIDGYFKVRYNASRLRENLKAEKTEEEKREEMLYTHWIKQNNLVYNTPLNSKELYINLSIGQSKKYRQLVTVKRNHGGEKEVHRILTDHSSTSTSSTSSSQQVVSAELEKYGFKSRFSSSSEIVEENDPEPEDFGVRVTRQVTKRKEVIEKQKMREERLKEKEERKRKKQLEREERAKKKAESKLIITVPLSSSSSSSDDEPPAPLPDVKKEIIIKKEESVVKPVEKVVEKVVEKKIEVVVPPTPPPPTPKKPPTPPPTPKPTIIEERVIVTTTTTKQQQQLQIQKEEEEKKRLKQLAILEQYSKKTNNLDFLEDETAGNAEDEFNDLDLQAMTFSYKVQKKEKEAAQQWEVSSESSSSSEEEPPLRTLPPPRPLTPSSSSSEDIPAPIFARQRVEKVVKKEKKEIQGPVEINMKTVNLQSQRQRRERKTNKRQASDSDDDYNVDINFGKKVEVKKQARTKKVDVSDIAEFQRNRLQDQETAKKNVLKEKIVVPNHDMMAGVEDTSKLSVEEKRRRQIKMKIKRTKDGKYIDLDTGQEIDPSMFKKQLGAG